MRSPQESVKRGQGQREGQREGRQPWVLKLEVVAGGCGVQGLGRLA